MELIAVAAAAAASSNYNDNYLINVATMANGLVAFLLRHHCTAFAAVCQGITADANNQIDIWKEIFRLHQLPGVPLMEYIVDAVSIDANTTRCITRFCHLVRNFGIIVTSLPFFDCFFIVIEWSRFAYCLWNETEMS